MAAGTTDPDRDIAWSRKAGCQHRDHTDSDQTKNDQKNLWVQISVLPTFLQSPKFNVHVETEREHSNLTNEGKGLSPNPLGAVAKPHYELIDEI